MSKATELLTTIEHITGSVVRSGFQWREQKRREIEDMRRTQALENKVFEARLRRQQLILEHELIKLQKGYNAELDMLEAKYAQDLQDYKQYLEAIDQLKLMIRASFTHMPDAIALTIHHHAKQLLNHMWDAEDLREKMNHEARFLQFMAAVHEDTLQLSNADETAGPALPVRTLKLMASR